MVLFLVAQVAPSEPVASAFLGQGIVGAVCLALAGVVVYLWRDSRSQENACRARETAYQARFETREVEWQVAWRERERECTTRVEAVQAQRVTDAQAVTAQLLRVGEQSTAVLTRASAAMETVDDALTANRTASEKLAEEIRRLAPGRYGSHG